MQQIHIIREDRGHRGDQVPLESLGRIIVDDSVVSHFNYKIPIEYITNKIVFDYVCFIKSKKHTLEEGF